MPKLAIELLIATVRTTTPHSYKIMLSGKLQDLEFHFRPPNEIDRGGVWGLYTPLHARYISGNWIDSDGNVQKKPDSLLDGNGKKIHLRDTAIEQSCRVEIVQAPKNPDDVYTATDLLRIMAVKDGPWPAIEKDAMRYWGGEGWDPKGAADPTEK